MVSKADRIYYEEELRYLAQEGQVFSQRYPDIARYLGLEGLDPNLRDPHSERIIEAFAFLNGRLRRFMDNQFPELVHALFNLVFPAYLRPLPSKTIMEFTPQTGMLDKPVVIPRFTSAYGDPRKPGSKPLEFTTCQQILVQPISLTKVHVDPDTKADFSLSVACQIHEGAKADSCEFDELEFMIFGDPSECYELYAQLLRHVTAIAVKGRANPARAIEIVWSGFQQDHNLNLEEDDHFSQLHLLRDFFDFPQRFFFFKLKGLHAALEQGLKDLTEFQVDFIFDRPFSPGYQFTAKNLKIFCSVIQNLFLKACEPFQITGKQLEYLITPDLTRNEYEVVRPDRVLASLEQERHEVKPYYHFTQETLGADKKWFYTMRRDLAFEQGWESYIRFMDLDVEGPDVLRGQNISISAWCTNRHHAQNLKIGQINKISKDIPLTITGKNITQPSKAHWPEIHSKADWDFISHLALNFADLASLGGLKRLLDLYNIAKSDSGKRRVAGILSAVEARDHHIMFGQCVSGRKLSLVCDESYFQHEGDLTLFSQVLGHFLRAYCPINSFVRLEILNSDKSETYGFFATY